MSPPLSLDPDRCNYRSLVLAGVGTVGQGILTVGRECLDGFEGVFLGDIDPDRCEIAARQWDYPVRQMDIEDTTSLVSCLSLLDPPILLVNVCSNIDTVRLRKAIRTLPVGCIDITESRTPENPQGRFTLSMPYTNQACHGAYPHLICQGSNPGMVEYVTRMLIDRLGPDQIGYSVTIYENDQLTASRSEKSGLVSWSPRDLIDEVVTTPQLEYVNSRLIEGPQPVSKRIPIQWQDRHYPAFKVGHEDIWNLSRLEQVSDAKFFYGFCADVMDILQSQSPNALQELRLPVDDEKIEGSERLAVAVAHSASGLRETVLWELNHVKTRDDYGLNAVQYQTALSTLFSMVLAQHTDIGLLAGTFNASTLPMDSGDWEILRELMDRLGIDFRTVPDNTVYFRETPVHSDEINVAGPNS